MKNSRQEFLKAVNPQQPEQMVVDFGTQDSTFCVPGQFEDLWLPYYRKINDWVHANTNWKPFKHSCGAVESFMPLFIKAGFVFNTVHNIQANVPLENLVAMIDAIKEFTN